jgi:hypothetical protein
MKEIDRMRCAVQVQKYKRLVSKLTGMNLFALSSNVVYCSIIDANRVERTFMNISCENILIVVSKRANSKPTT